MGMITECGKESVNPLNILKYIKFRSRFRCEHPDYMDADGLLCFVGPQGSGKTLSAVNYVYKLMQMYPGMKLCTNLLLSDYPVVTYEQYVKTNAYEIENLKDAGHNDDEIQKYMKSKYLQENRVYEFVDNDDLSKYENGEKGIVFLIDEIQLYLNSLERKNINLDVVTQISQQRKQRVHIVTTCQVFGRMAKPLREQFSNVVICKNYLGFIQKNMLVSRGSLENETSSDTQVKGKVEKLYYWIHDPEMYKRYDTYYVIKRGNFVSGENQMKEGVYDASIRLSGNN